MAGTPIDGDLILADEDLNDANEGAGTAVILDGPGPYDGELHVKFGAVTGTNPTLDINLEASLDGGSTWFVTGVLRQFDDDDTIPADASAFHYSRPVFIPGVPAPTSPQWSTAKPDPVRVRVNYTVTGSDTPQFADGVVWLATPDVGATSARNQA